MIQEFRRVEATSREFRTALQVLVAFVVLGCSLLVGLSVDRIPVQFVATGLLIALVSAIGATLLWQRLGMVLTFFVAFSAFINRGIGAGNPDTFLSATMIVFSAAFFLWIVKLFVLPDQRITPSELNVPLIAFTVAILFSWVAGYMAVDWRVNLPRDIILVQIGQFLLYFVSFTTFWLAANNRMSEQTLQLWVICTILVGAFVFTLQIRQGFTGGRLFSGARGAILMWPVVFYVAQLLFNPKLKPPYRGLAIVFLAAWAIWSMTVVFEWKSGWVPACIAIFIMVWIKNWRVAALLTLVGAITFGALYMTSSVIFERALVRETASFGRPIIWYDVMRLTSRSPLFGLGIATYEFFWLDPTFVAESIDYFDWADPRRFSPPSHSMLIDIIAQTGIFGTVMFLWLTAAAFRLCYRAIRWFPPGFMRAYAIAVSAGFVAIWISSVAFGDWLLPFVYNINLRGFQHSMYSWLFLGSLAALDPALWPKQDSHA